MILKDACKHGMPLRMGCDDCAFERMDAQIKILTQERDQARHALNFVLEHLQSDIRKAKIEENKACAIICEEYSTDKWRLYKGREPYKGNEVGRADPVVEGQSDGADAIQTLIEARYPDEYVQGTELESQAEKTGD